MKIDVNDFKGIYTNVDNHQVPMEYFKRAENVLLGNGYVETKGISLNPISAGLPTPSKDFIITDIFPCELRSDNSSEVPEYTSFVRTLYIFTKIAGGFITYEFIIEEKGKTPVTLTNLSEIQRTFPCPSTPTPNQIYQRNGIVEIYTDHASFLVEYLNRELSSYTSYSNVENGEQTGIDKLDTTYTGFYVDFLVRDFPAAPVLIKNHFETPKYYTDSEDNYALSFTAGVVNDFNGDTSPYKSLGLTIDPSSIKQLGLRVWSLDNTHISFFWEAQLQKNGENYLQVVIGFNVRYGVEAFGYEIESGFLTIQAKTDGIDITDYVTAGTERNLTGAPIWPRTSTETSYRLYNWWTQAAAYSIPHLSTEYGVFTDNNMDYLWDVNDTIPYVSPYPTNTGFARQINKITGISLYSGTLVRDLHPYGFSIAADLNPRVLIAYNLSGRNIVFDRKIQKVVANNGADDKYLISYSFDIPKSLSPQITEILVFVKTDLLVNTEFTEGTDYVLAKSIKRLTFEEEDVEYDNSAYHQYHDLITKTELTGITLQQVCGIYFYEKRPQLAVPITIQKEHTLIESFGFMISRGTLYYSAVGYGIIQKNMFYPVTVLNINENASGLIKVGADLGVFVSTGIRVIHIDNVDSTPVFSYKTKLPHIKKSNVIEIGDTVLFASNYGLMLVDGYEAQDIGEPIGDKIQAATNIQVEYNDYYQMIYLVLDNVLYQFDIKRKAWTSANIVSFLKFYPGTKPIVSVAEDDNILLYEINYGKARGVIEFNDFNFTDNEGIKRFYDIFFDKESGPAYSGLPALPANPKDVDPKVTYEADADKFCVTANNNIPQGDTYGWILEAADYRASFKITQGLSKILSLKIEGIFKLKAITIIFDIIESYMEG